MGNAIPLILMLSSVTKLKTVLLLLCLALIACDGAKNDWSDAQLSVISSLSLASLGELPEVPSNRFANDERAVALGRQLFFDKRFSANSKLSCASCHQPKNAFTDGLTKGVGVHATGRNTQSLIGVAYQDWFYWDGRKDSLWSQALVPFEAANEMGSSRVQVLKIVGADPVLRQQFEALFGRFPESAFDESIRPNAGPWGDAETRENWFRIPTAVQTQINSAYANIGKALEAYERTIAVPVTKFDRYAEALINLGEKSAEKFITHDEKLGLALFIDQSRTHCLRCHNGPLFSNSEFHNVGSGNFDGPELDFGRFFGIQAVIQDEFNCLGDYSDADAADCNALRFLPKQMHNDMQGAYKTPTLRYLNQTGPYFHDGRYDTVDQALDHYLQAPTMDSEAPALQLSDKERQQLLAFLAMLNSVE